MMERAESHFVEVGGHTQKVYHPAVAATAEVQAQYPTLRAATEQDDPGLTHTTAIANVTQLQAMADDLAGNYYLTGDIDATATTGWNTGAGFDPIGPDAWTSFTGTLDGGGYTITGLFINRPTESYVGLFGHLGSAAKVANLTFASATVTGLRYVGVLAGYAYNPAGAPSALLIQNVHSSGTVQIANAATAEDVGGLVGWAYALGDRVDLVDCTSSCTITDNFTRGYAGGMVGLTWGGGADLEVRFRNCSATGNVTSLNSIVGGLIGDTHGYAIVLDSHATGNVSGVGYVGGLIGQPEGGNATIARCYATGNVTASGSAAGGLVGSHNQTSSITDCYATGNVTATTDYAGGLSGSTTPSADCTIDTSYSIGLVTTAGSNIGGFNGLLGVGSLITGCYWDTDTSGQATSDDGGTGKTTAQMKTKTTYSGWDFTTVWDIVEYAAATSGTAEYWTETDIGYSHLIGETVSILADGVVQDDQVVSDSGTITETAFSTATNVHVGLKYESKLKPMKPVSQPDMMSKTVTCKQMGISVHNTDEIKYGVHDNDMKQINFDDVQWKNKCEIDGLFTGTVAVSVPDGFSVNCPLQIIMNAPLPATIRAMIPKVDSGD